MTTGTVLLTLTEDADNMLYRFARLIALPEPTTCESCNESLEVIAIEVALDADMNHAIHLHPACLTDYDVASAANAEY